MNLLNLALLAEAETSSHRLTWELGRENPWIWCLGGLALLIGVIWAYRRDTQEIATGWRLLMAGLRMLVWIGLFWIVLDPQERAETEVTRSSRVAFLIDASASMGFPESGAAVSSTAGDTKGGPSRTTAIREILEKSPLLDELRKTHDLEFYTFDRQPQLRGRLPKPSRKADSALNTEPAPDWGRWLTTQGVETRLGDCTAQLIREVGGETLSGLVVISDGSSNAGIELNAAHEAALAAQTRVITVGVGGTEKPVNLQVQNIQAPTHAHVRDPFTITAFVSGQGLVGKSAQIELLSREETPNSIPIVLQKKSTELVADGTPVSVAFDVLPDAPGRRMYSVRAIAPAGVTEFSTADNEKPLAPVEIVERKTKVLVIAGGPTRDYQFVRNLLFRGQDRSVELHVWLQSGDPAISQESSKLLSELPKTREDLFAFDVMVAFDPDWNRVPVATRQLLSDWLHQHAGGLILVAGQVFTPTLSTPKDDLKSVLAWYPVKLPGVYDSEVVGSDFVQPWPIEFTREGRESDFLTLTPPNATLPVDVWKQFAGFFRCYPSEGIKPGGTVFAYHSDPRGTNLRGEKSILLASQFFGAGRIMYLGSSEIWRLRAIDEEYYDRFWINLIREVGQGRLLRGTNRALFLLDRSTFPLGAAVPIRARLLDAQYRPLSVDKQSLDLTDPQGRGVQPAVDLLRNPVQPGEYQGAFFPSLPGRYRLRMTVPQINEEVVSYIQVQLPDFEYLHPEQDEAALRRLATTELGGSYLPLKEMTAKLPQLLPDRSQTRIQSDLPRPLWDRMWLMWLLVGLLAVEWISRKLMKLA